jgi:hypothetical protein
MALSSTQPLKEMSTKNHPRGKERSARKADNLTGICESIVNEMGNLDVSQPYGPSRSVTGIAPPRWPGFKPGFSHVGFVVDEVALGYVFFEYFVFPFQSSFHQFLHNHHHLSSGAGTIGQ